MSDDKWTIVTGATGGIGEAIVTILSRRGMPVVMACRNPMKAQNLRQRLLEEIPGSRVETMTLDLASFDSIRNFVDEVRSAGLQVSTLVNNAGVMCKNFTRTVDGLEMTAGVNVVGTYLLSRLLAPLLVSGKTESMSGELSRSATETNGPSGSGRAEMQRLEKSSHLVNCVNGTCPETFKAAAGGYQGRIVNTVSCTARIGRVDTSMFYGNEQSYHRMRVYSRSKRALLMVTDELAERLAPMGISVLAADPGVVDTAMISMQRWYDPLADLFFRPFIKRPERGAAPIVAAVCADACITEELFRGRKHVPIGQAYRQSEARRALVGEIERLTGLDE